MSIMSRVSKEGYFYLLIAVFSLIIVGSINIWFLRAESGYLFNVVAGDWPVIWKVYKNQFLLSSYNSHWFPVGALLEIGQTALFGTDNTPWMVRQWIVLAAVSAAVFAGLSGLLRRDLGRGAAPLALALTVLWMTQPGTVDSIAWPFIVFQFILIALFALTIRRLADDTLSPGRQAAGIAVLSYLSLQATGIGLALAAGGLAVLGAEALRCRLHGQSVRPWVLGFAVLAVLTAGHALMMMSGPNSAPTDWSAVLKGVPLWLVLHLLWGWPWSEALGTPTVELMTSLTAVAPLVVALWAAAILWLLLVLLRDRSEEAGIKRVLLYTLVTYSVYVALAAMRNAQVDPFLSRFMMVGGRYVVVFTALVLPLLAFVASRLLRRVLPQDPLKTGRLGAAAAAVTAGAMLFYPALQDALPKKFPSRFLSHEEEWHAVVAEAREAVAAGRPVENRSMKYLVEFDFSLEQLRPLLEKEVGRPVEFRSAPAQ